MMINKLWYQREEGLTLTRDHIQLFIELYCSNSPQFKVVEDIVLENCGKFLEIILRHYEQYHFDIGQLSDLAEALDVYFLHAYGYMDDLPQAFFPSYTDDDDIRNLAIHIIEYIQLHNYTIFSEDIPYLISYLYTTPDKEITEANKKIEAYLKQFDHSKRNNENSKRWKAITEERLEAIKNNKPLPIRPMSIELDSCYKK